MTSHDSQPRASPPQLSGDIWKLVRTAYDDPKQQMMTVETIQRHLICLCDAGDFIEAERWLVETESGIRVEAKRRSAQKRRASFQVITRITGPLVIGFAALAKLFLDHFGH